MDKLPINAKVECTDGVCGQSLSVIVDPAGKVTHLVVEDRGYARLVPIDQVSQSSSALIRLRCTKDELSQMKPFVETHYIIKEEPDYSMYKSGEGPPSYSTVGAVYIPIRVERIPVGEFAVRWGTRVEATDGYVGRVGELAVDTDNGQVTHFVLQEGHLWGKREITLPVSAVDRVDAFEDAVFLRLDKHAIESLPSILARRQRRIRVPERKAEVLAIIFDTPDGAEDAFEFLKDVQRQQSGGYRYTDGLRILNAALLVKDAQGELALRETGDLDAKQGRLFGAITGGLVGLLGGPVGAIIGAAAGAGTGHLVAQQIDRGFSDQFLANFQERLQANSSALIVLVEHEWLQEMSKALAGLEGVVLHQTLTDDMVQQFLDASEAED